MAEQLLSKRS